MSTQSRESFTYLEVFRPVYGLDEFLVKVRHIGGTILGSEPRGSIMEPSIDESGQPLQSLRSIDSPRLSVYSPEDVRLDLIDRRVEPRMNYANRFRWVANRVIRKPGEPAPNSIPRDENELQRRYEVTERDSLGYNFSRIGERFDIHDQDELHVKSATSLLLSIDPAQENQGFEIALSLDPASPVTRMLVKQAEFCLKSLAKHSPKAANPYSVTNLNVPIAITSPSADNIKTDRFISAVTDLLPIRLVLGPFRDVVGGASWQAKNKK